MIVSRALTRPLAGLAFVAAAMSAHADWLVQPESEVAFVTTKNVHKTEVHQLSGVTGSMTDAGAVDIAVAVSSVETGIPIRNERMQEMLFKAVDFPDIQIHADAISADALESIKAGGVARFTQPATLTIMDQSSDIEMNLVATFSGDGSLVVSTVSPILTDARTVGLEAGVDALKTVAGLDSIGYVVPVTFVLTLK